MRELLRKLPLFSDLSDADLSRLCELSHDLKLAAGETLFREGEEGDRAYVISAGELEILKVTGPRELLLAVRKRGELVGEAALLEAVPRNATARARTDCELIAIDKEEIEQLVSSSPSAARQMFFTALARWRGTTAALRQSEKMAQLGTLTAGVAHELNNPAAAVKRAAAQLAEGLARLGELRARLAALPLDAEQRGRIAALDREAQKRAKAPAGILDGLERSDREEAMAESLEDAGVNEAWQVAPGLAGLGFRPEDLPPLAGELGDAFAPVVEALSAEQAVRSLLRELGDGAGRISEIVGALKSYAYLDQGPVQAVDLIEGIENTLVILRHKLKGIRIRRELERGLPRIDAHGSELNQVWTNLLDNAADALEGKGEIAVRARREGEMIVVEVEDDGPGIPEPAQPRVFEAFFTTKPPGKGTGLGLSISYDIVVNKHRGDIKVSSRPGKTCFEVRVPIRLGGG